METVNIHSVIVMKDELRKIHGCRGHKGDGLGGSERLPGSDPRGCRAVAQGRDVERGKGRMVGKEEVPLGEVACETSQI